MAFNSFETFGSLFFKNILNDSNLYSQMATFLSVSSILSFILFSGISTKIGRKWTIVIGLILLIIGLLGIAFVSLTIHRRSLEVSSWKIFYIAMSLIMGIGWALVNINSFPMVVEYANKNNVGKFTSYYYMASMLAQSITPIIVGLFMDFHQLGQNILFFYASSLMGIAIVTFLFIKEKYTVKQRVSNAKKKSALENLGDIDN